MNRFSALAAAGLLAVSGWLPAQEAPAVERREEGNLVIEAIPEIPQSLRDRLNQYQNTRSAYFSDWLPDGSGILFATRFGDTGQLHIITEAMGVRRQVTFYEEPVTRGSFRPAAEEADRFLFTMDEDGTEQDQIYLHDLNTGTATMLTDGESVNRGPLWSNTDSRFAFNSTRANGTDWGIYVADADAPTSPPMTVLEETGYWYAMDWAPDDSRLLIGQYISVNESKLEVLTLENGERMPITEDVEEPVRFGDAVFDSDGGGIFYTSDAGSEFQQLHYYELEHNVRKTLLSDVNWNVEDIELSNDGGTLAVVTNENGLSRLRLLNTDTLEVSDVELPPGIIASMGFSPDDTRLGMSIYRASSPGDVYVYNLQEGALTQWTQSEVGGLPVETFADAEVFRYPTFDTTEDGSTRQIPAFMVKPEGEGPFPVLLNIHGGPESQARPYFSSFTQFLVNEMGIAVVYPNVRGSAGYGKSWLKLDNARLREDSVKDIGALLEWIAEQPELDEDRVVAMGGSYGGYMALATLAHYADQLRGAINIVGISNFVTFLESTKEYRRDLRRVEYGDERDPEMRAFLESISPTNMTERMTKPLFVVQGYNDPRVPYTEAEQIVEGVRATGTPVWFLMAMDEGHGFSRKENRDEYQAAAALFLQQFLLPEQGAGEAPAAETEESGESPEPVSSP